MRKPTLLALLVPLLLGACGPRQEAAAPPPPPPPVENSPAPEPVPEPAPEEAPRPEPDAKPAEPTPTVTTPDGFSAYSPVTEVAAAATEAPAETPEIQRWKAETEARPTAAGFRKLAEACEAAQRYADAAAAYRREGAIRRKGGDVNGALVEEAKANRWESEVRLYCLASAAPPDSPARFEPAAGCYVGTILERDARFSGDYDAFNRETGKPHAVFFDYRSYGREFPARWAAALKDAGAAAQIALEPTGGLDSVQDDNYLREFARQAKEAEIPIFLRFAAEMNGDWTPYGGNPARYIEKWRLVHRVMREEAPNVAMVWTPNSVPEETIPSYYPGDEYVDWVGLNFYAVHHHNNRLDDPAEHENPADVLRYIYQRYAARKPIMICEFAATHYCKADEKELPEFAADKMRALYSALPLLYPRVKAVHWYNIDNRTNSMRADRRTNNFSLTDDDTVLTAYKEAIRRPYFKSQVETDGPTGELEAYQPLTEKTVLSGKVRLDCWAKSFVENPVVIYRLDGRRQFALPARPYEAVWDTSRVKNGPHTLEVTVLAGNRVAATRKVTVTVKNGETMAANEREYRGMGRDINRR